MGNTNLVEVIKQISVEAMNAQNPTGIVYGKVISAEPLQIQINSKMTLDETFLVLTKNVSDYETETDISFAGEGVIEIDGINERFLKGISCTDAKIKMKNALKAGDEVVMIKMQGGQKFVVLDKVGG